MGLITRKKVAQFGVLLFTLSLLQAVWAPYIFLLGPDYLVLPLSVLSSSGIFILFIVALIPPNSEEKWGSIWPLSGYDNAIDAIYTRGPWLVRFKELDEQDRERGVSSGMATMFGEDHL